jgi:hypothetical protein
VAFDYEAAKAEFGVGRAREMEKESRGAVSAQTDAPQATSQPQAGGGEKKAGIGGGGWNEDFDEAWGRRVLENPKLKELFGLSGYESLRDEETRRQVNRWLRENKGGEGGGGTAAGAAQSAPAASTTGAAKKAEAGGVVQPPGTTGKTSLPGGVKPPPSGPPKSSTSILAPGRLPSSLLWQNTVLPASGGEIPAQATPWWPSYPTGGLPSMAKPGTASMQAAALAAQRDMK